MARPRVALLGLLTATGAMAIDSYVPALPAVQRDFQVDATAAQWTLGLFMVGAAVGQAFWGPLSDRLGRRGPMLMGLVVYIIGALMAAAAPSLQLLLLARLLQAVGASAGMVLARAVVSDLWPPDASARIYSVLMLVLGVTAMVAPLVGGGLLSVTSWRAIFLLLAGAGGVCLAWAWVDLRESLPASRRIKTRFWMSLRAYGALLNVAPFLWGTLVTAFAMGGMFALLAGSAFMFIQQRGWSTGAYTALYALSSAAFIAFCQINVWALARASAGRLLALGLWGQVICALGLLTVVGLHLESDILLSSLLVLWIGLLGLTLGNSVSVAMQRADPAQAGAASAVIGVAEFALSALTPPLSSLGSNVSMSTALVAAACAVLCLACALQAERSARSDRGAAT
ncbi:Bcr/CflA family efflux MFS transporter [Caulobacter sp. AP07]|uniref:Bcr/CflA family efflux MFS transporter n=1 Tax=Caulobacter sp. AP07 TaxID=1144304 RepID=UPI0002E0C708|nr:Bcr/CflA family efflux MFS transporter [Caulobacter sp. AP07]